MKGSMHLCNALIKYFKCDKSGLIHNCMILSSWFTIMITIHNLPSSCTSTFFPIMYSYSSCISQDICSWYEYSDVTTILYSDSVISLCMHCSQVSTSLSLRAIPIYG